MERKLERNLKRIRKRCFASLAFFAAFILWTALVCNVDVQPVGPMGSSVGLAGINQAVHRLTGVHLSLYAVTDWLGLVPIGVCVGFAVLGLIQWLQRKSILRVDRSILALGALYLAAIAAYLFFERFPVNFRPVLIDGRLEASYPSSTTLLTMCVMPSALMHLRTNHRTLRRCAALVIIAFTAFMVIIRLISGVHWVTDIIGGALLSAALTAAYSCAALPD